MKAVIVPYTEEHMIFLWKHFREWSIHDFYVHCGTEKVKAYRDNCCVEIRSSYGHIIACGLSKQNELWFSAVDIDYRGDNLQKRLIDKRIDFIQKKKYSTIEVTVRSSNIASVINLYKCGFKVKERIRYQDDAEGFKMQKSI